MAGLPVIRVGGKGSSLSSSSVYAIANGLAQVSIDSSALDRLASSSSSTNLKPHQLISLLPSCSSIEESRASLVVLLSKLLSLSGSPNIRTLLPDRIAAALNSSSSQDLGLESLDLTEEEAIALEKLKDFSAFYGICALLDHQSAALATVSDAVAALSCEALKADVAAFNSIDAGDGYAAKEVIGVANDLKVLLNGSKLVGKVETEAVSEIPKIHARLRVQVKSVHATTREELNSGAKVGKGGSRSVRSERTALLALGAALFDLGDYSLRRAKLDLEAVGSENLLSRLVELFEKQCPSGESLRSGFKLVQELVFEEAETYVKFAHQVNVLMELVQKIVTWEAITVFVALEGAELTGKGQGGEVNGEVNAKAEKKNEKKKKKVSLGRGTTVMVQLIKDKLQGKGGNAVDSSELLENWVKELLSLFDPKNSDFDGVLNKVKEIVESNETRRLPKLPKVMAYLKFCFHCFFVFVFLTDFWIVMNGITGILTLETYYYAC